MGVGKFDRNMPLPPRGAVTIKGPFNPQDRAVDAARVLFLIVQGEGADAVIINGEGTWERAHGDEWSGTIPRRGLAFRGRRNGNLGTGARTWHRTFGGYQAGQAPRRWTQIRSAVIESLTWCADFHFV